MSYDPFTTSTTDNVNPPESIVAVTFCNRVTIQENGDATQDYQVRRASTSSHPLKRLAGTPFTFSAERGSFWKPGDTVGFVETLTGSITMLQVEEYV
jgi:hypothetical protein